MTDLEAGYRRCRELTKQYGTTYYWGARLLPPAQRRDVFTVYALDVETLDVPDEATSAACRFTLLAHAIDSASFTATFGLDD